MTDTLPTWDVRVIADGARLSYLVRAESAVAACADAVEQATRAQHRNPRAEWAVLYPPSRPKARPTRALTD